MSHQVPLVHDDGGDGRSLKSTQQQARRWFWGSDMSTFPWHRLTSIKYKWEPYGTVRLVYNHMGWEYVSREKKSTMVNFLIFVQKNVSTIRFQEIKIRPFRDFEKKAFFSLFLMRKRLSSGQKWFLRPYFPLFRGMFVSRSGLRFSFRALEVPEPRVRKRPFSLTEIWNCHNKYGFATKYTNFYSKCVAEWTQTYRSLSLTVQNFPGKSFHFFQ